MKGSHYAILLGVAAAAGTVAGVLSERKQPVKGALLGCAAAVAAGSLAAGVYEYIRRNQIPFYSSSSALYEEQETI